LLKVKLRWKLQLTNDDIYFVAEAVSGDVAFKVGSRQMYYVLSGSQ